MKKSFICLVLTAFMAVSSLPRTAFAETAESNAEAAAEGTEIKQGAVFTIYEDVAEDAWYYGAAYYLKDKAVMKGTDITKFSPDEYVTRGMLAQIINNIDGKKDKVYWSYLDVDENAWYADSVAWCSETGLMKGYGNNLFGPEDNITREQLVFTLYNYAKYKELGNLETTGIQLLDYSDYMSVSGYAGGAMQWALINGIIKGKDNKMLDPQGNATRAEVAQVVKNFMIFYNL